MEAADQEAVAFIPACVRWWELSFADGEASYLWAGLSQGGSATVGNVARGNCACRHRQSRRALVCLVVFVVDIAGHAGISRNFLFFFLFLLLGLEGVQG